MTLGLAPIELSLALLELGLHVRELLGRLSLNLSDLFLCLVLLLFEFFVQCFDLILSLHKHVLEIAHFRRALHVSVD